MAEKFTRSKGLGFGDVNPQTGAPKAPTLKDTVALWDHGSKAKYRAGRAIGPLMPIGLHSIKIKKKDGEVIEIKKPCLAFNRKKGLLDTTKIKKCGYCGMGPQQYLGTRYFQNLIDREAQENAPRKIKPPTKKELKSGFRDIDSPHWNPVFVMGMPTSLAKRVKEIDDRNLVKKGGKKKHYEIRDPEHGIDVEFKFDKKEQAANMYNAVKSDEGKTPLTKEELKYLLWDLNTLYPLETSEVSKKEAASMATRAPDDIAKELKKMGKSKASSDSSASDSGSGSDSASSADDKKKSKKKSKKDSSDSSGSGSGSGSASGSSDLSGSDSSGKGKDSDDSGSSSSASGSNSGSDSSGSGSDSSDGGKGKKGSKSKAGKAKGKAKSGKAGKGKSDASGSDASDSASEVSGSDSSGDKKKSKKKSKKASSDSSGSGSDLSGIDSGSDSGSDSSGDKKKKSKAKAKPAKKKSKK